MHTSSGSWGKWAVFEDCQVILVALKEGDRVWVSSSPLIPLNLVCFFDAVSCLLVHPTLFWQWICLLWGLRWWWWTGHIFWVSTPCSKSYMHPFPTCSGGPTPFMMIGIMPLPACSHGAPLPLWSLPLKQSSSEDPSWLCNFNPSKGHSDLEWIKDVPAHRLLQEVCKYMGGVCSLEEVSWGLQSSPLRKP